MSKINEKEYFKKIGNEGVVFSISKPYSDRTSLGCLMHNIASVASLLKNHYGTETLKIIDIGCGSGWTSNQFALIGHDVVGVDISPEAISAAKKTFIKTNLKYLETDYDKMKSIYKSSFDAAVFIDSLHHSDSIEKTLKSARGALKKGGICIVCEPGAGHSKSPDAIEAVEKFGVTEADLPPNEIVKAAKKAGFKRAKIYASPSLMHRTLYWEYESSKLKKYIKHDLIRVALLITLFIFKRKKEGIVLLYN